jgi:adenylylsulfate kinase-like enzyme
VPTVTVLSGYSGSGKSTVASNLFWGNDYSPCVLLTADHFKFPDGQDTTAFFIRLAKHYVSNGLSVVFDGVNLHHLDKKRWQKVFPQVIWLHMDTPIETCIARDAQRPFPVGADNIRKQGL